MAGEIVCVNYERAPGEAVPLAAGSGPLATGEEIKLVWLLEVSNTGETATRTIGGEDVLCKKLKMYTAVSFDLVADVRQCIKYNYKSVLTAPEWKEAVTENSAIKWNFTGGTTANGSSVPKYKSGGVWYEARNVIESDVYVPAAECTNQAFFQSIVSIDVGDPFDKSLFVYARKGGLRASDKIIVGYGIVQSVNIVDENFGKSYADMTKASTVTETSSFTPALAEAKIAVIAARPYMHETSEDGVYSLE